MKISDVLRSLVDVIDRNSADLPDAPSHEANASDFTAFTGDLKPVELPDVKSATRLDRTEKTSTGNALPPEELFIPPLQTKLELLKKSQSVANIYDDGAPAEQEQEREERDGPWHGAHHEYEYVGASTGVVEGGCDDVQSASRDVAVSEEIARMKSLALVESEDDECEDEDEDESEDLDESSKMRKFMKMIEAEKPDFLDLDKDGNEKEPMKKAADEVDEGCHDDEQLDELSNRTLASYRRKAADMKDMTDLNKINNRFTGRTRAERKMIDRDDSESNDQLTKEDQLDELSRDTLKSYAKKASLDRGRRGIKAGAWYDHPDRSKPNVDKMTKRQVGIERAVDRLEEESVNELSRPTLKDYIKKAAPDQLRHGQNFVGKAAGPLGRAFDGKHPKTGEAPIEWDARKMSNRGKGIDRAVDRLEEEQIEEYADAGHGCDWQLKEGGMPEVSTMIKDILNSPDAHEQLYDIMSGRDKSPEGQYLSNMANHMASELSSEHGLHPDDDFDEIINLILDNLDEEYGHDVDECSMSRLQELAGLREDDIDLFSGDENEGTEHYDQSADFFGQFEDDTFDDEDVDGDVWTGYIDGKPAAFFKYADMQAIDAGEDSPGQGWVDSSLVEGCSKALDEDAELARIKELAGHKGKTDTAVLDALSDEFPE